MDGANWKIYASNVRRGRLLGDAVESVVVGRLCDVALHVLIAPMRVPRIIESPSLSCMHAIGVDAGRSLVNP